MARSTLSPDPVKQEAPAQTTSRDHAGRANTWRNIRLIARREYKNQVTRRSFLVTTIIYLLGIVVAAFVPIIIQAVTAHTTSQTHMVVINQAGSVANMDDAALLRYMTTALNGQATGGSAHFVLTTAPAADLSGTKAAVTGGQVNGLLVLERAANQEIRYSYYATTGDPTDSDVVQVQRMAGQLSVLDRAERQHLTADQISSLFAQPQFALTNLQQNQGGRSTADWVTGLILAYLGVVLMFMTNMVYGAGVAQGVAEEKGNRIMELLMLAATPFQLMTGKILGIGSAGLTQMSILVAVGLAMLALQNPLHTLFLGTGGGGLSLNITGASVTMLLLVLLYFILAFALYSSLYAAAGALVQRQDEAQHASTPVTMLFVIGYIVSLSIVSIPSVPDALWFKIMSYVPFWTPTTMLVRIAVGTVQWWEIPLTIVLMGLAFLGSSWVSGRVYRYGVLSYGQRFRMKQLLKVVLASQS
jgi:ABC-2 type transport system permease protein